MYLERMGHGGGSEFSRFENFSTEEISEGNDQIEKYTEEFSRKFSGLDILDRDEMLEAEKYVIDTFGKEPEAGKAVLSLLNEKTSAQLQDINDRDQAAFVEKVMKDLGNLSEEDIDSIMADR